MSQLEQEVNDLLLKYIMRIPGAETTRFELRSEIVTLIEDKMNDFRKEIVLLQANGHKESVN
jgi:hypothetical protein